MHPSILGAGLCALATAAAATPIAPSPACPRPQAAVEEALFSADCADCWSAPADGDATPASRPAPSWRFDWIAPGGDAAPLALGALPEAAERAQRLGWGSGLAMPVLQRQAASPPRPGLQLQVVSGPAWQGYFGLQLTLRTPRTPRSAPPATPAAVLPAGSTAWLALIEQVSAGSDGTPVARALVRSVAGPLPLAALVPGKALTHLRALRWPASAEPARLQARAWIEGPDGRLLAVAADRCADR